ncbi:Uroporphyrinogen decarboxylase (URO-D) [Moorella glycerini]|uniref:Methylcobalamin:coenzyme M methyltransferase n=1 Tax=Neomoorella stamsii TaxID=1266720 RepID=A0A9X7J2R3_9FIRM|nr:MULTISPECIES: uroporphyrinogen decarboxylase family protein [Moorella]PRR71547.1 methylcobalamin:coenzyme M methyltransferase [Moorella stamsii]CEP66580.1 Uroporphyrinogen decarboxylase (URO-D) [Moorella glycerini]
MALELYEERLKRIETAAHLGKPDRVPVVLGIEYFAARYKGMKMAEFIWNTKKGAALILETALELGVDGLLSAMPVSPVAAVAAVFPTRIKLPGRDLGEDELLQFNEAEPLMEVEDYDFIIKHGWKAFFPKLLERCIDFMPLKEALAQLEALGELAVTVNDCFKKAGIPVITGGGIVPPSQLFSAARTIGEFFKDLRRYPQKVIDAMEAALPDVVETGLAAARSSGIDRLIFGATRECGGFVSLAMYERFFHPIFLRIINACVKAGCEVLLHFDSDWTKNLGYLRDFPAGKCILHMDGSTDIFKAKEVLGGHMALKGDVPPSLLTIGTPEKVDTYCRRLIAEVGREGGFILAQGCGVPINAKIENVKAMVEAAQKYGVYSCN